MEWCGGVLYILTCAGAEGDAMNGTRVGGKFGLEMGGKCHYIASVREGMEGWERLWVLKGCER